MSPFGISSEQYNVLRILRGAGGAGLPTLEIADRMLSRSPNITRLVDRLIAKKLVRRVRSRQDRRVVMITITPEGRELLAQLDAVVDGLFKRFPPTTEAEMRTLLDVLDRIRDHMAVKTVAEHTG
jgi:DNA-binding MarR family transcriptional regulator